MHNKITQYDGSYEKDVATKHAVACHHSYQIFWDNSALKFMPCQLTA